MIDNSKPGGLPKLGGKVKPTCKRFFLSRGSCARVDENGTYLGIWTTNDTLLLAPQRELVGAEHMLRPSEGRSASG